MPCLAKSNGETIEEHTKKLLKITRVFNDKRLNESAVYHDIGKANNDFQEAVTVNRNPLLRHEIVSAIIYLANSEEPDAGVLQSILFHHKYTGIKDEILNSKLLLKTVKIDYDCIIETLNNLGVNVRGDLPERAEGIKEKGVAKTIKELFGSNFYRNIDKVLTGRLMNADHLASAGITEYGVIRERRAYSTTLEKGWTLRDIQKKALESDGDVIIIEAPTGSGKTEAGLFFAEKNVVGTTGRIIYTLNTKSAINTLAKRLIEYYGRENVSVNYSYILPELLEELNADKTVVKHFTRPVKITTPDQLYKALITDWKESAIVSAEIPSSTIILDEVQTQLREPDYLLCLINEVRELGGKTVIMSATIPDELYEHADRVITATDNRKVHQPEIADSNLEDIEVFEENGKIVAELDGKRIIANDLLIVANTVSTAVKVYLKSNVEDKLLLHSRFKLKDRLKKEKLLADDKPKLLVATQTVEASVDVSYEKIITEPAPIDSLVQRLGRVNRHDPVEPKEPNVFVTSRFDKRKIQNVYVIRNVLKSIELLSRVQGDKISKDDERELVKEFCGSTVKLSSGFNCSKRVNDYLDRFSDVVAVVVGDDVRVENFVKVPKWVIRKYGEKKGKVFVLDAEYSDETGLILSDKPLTI